MRREENSVLFNLRETSNEEPVPSIEKKAGKIEKIKDYLSSSIDSLKDKLSEMGNFDDTNRAIIDYFYDEKQRKNLLDYIDEEFARAKNKDKLKFYQEVLDEKIEKIISINSATVSLEGMTIREAVIEALGAMDAAEKAGINISGVKRRIKDMEKAAYENDFLHKVILLKKISEGKHLLYSPEYTLEAVRETIESAKSAGIHYTELMRKLEDLYADMLKKFERHTESSSKKAV